MRSKGLAIRPSAKPTPYRTPVRKSDPMPVRKRPAPGAAPMPRKRVKHEPLQTPVSSKPKPRLGPVYTNNRSASTEESDSEETNSESSEVELNPAELGTDYIATPYRNVRWHQKFLKWEGYLRMPELLPVGFYDTDLEAAHEVNAQCEALDIDPVNKNLPPLPEKVWDPRGRNADEAEKKKRKKMEEAFLAMIKKPIKKEKVETKQAVKKERRVEKIPMPPLERG